MKNSTLLAIVIALFISGVVIHNYDQETLNEAVKEFDIFGSQDNLSSEIMQDQFDYFVSKNSKSYETYAEHQKRYQIFSENFNFIQEHNKNAVVKGFTLAINKFGDLTDDEFANTYLEIKVPDENMEKIRHNEMSDNPFEQMMKETATDQAVRDLKIPGSVDWVAAGAVTPVGDQGQCGSCWAFSAIAAIEGANYITNRVSEELSEQQLVDCVVDDQGVTFGCNGGNMQVAFLYAHNNSLCTEADYPYTAVEGQCFDFWSCSTKHILTGHEVVEPLSRLSLYSAIATGPVSTAVDADSKEFRFYSTGIFSEGCDENLNHAVTAVGYSYQPFFWFWRNNYISIKNSWGTGWGEDGFMRLSSNNEEGKGTCGAFMYNTYPIIKAN